MLDFGHFLILNQRYKCQAPSPVMHVLKCSFLLQELWFLWWGAVTDSRSPHCNSISLIRRASRLPTRISDMW